MKLCLFFYLGLLIEIGKAELNSEVPYTVQERSDVFGFSRSVGIPDVDHVTLLPLVSRRPDEVRYRLRWNSKVADLSLSPTQDLFSPGCMLHYYQKNHVKNVHPCRHDAHCYYEGNSENYTDSWVAANVCDGMKGVIKLEDDLLYIHPDPHSARLRTAEQPHIVYRYTGSGTEFCGTTGGPEEHLYEVHRSEPRTRRAVRKKFVETSLVIDPEMLNFHGKQNIMDYVATIFNIANKLFKEPSLGDDITLSLIEVIIVESYEDFATPITADAPSTLKNFCKWRANNLHSRFVPDVSILLSRMNLVKDGDSSLTGLANPSGVCMKDMKCAVVEDTGTYMGHGLAHEIGHLLGMQHDTPENNCSGIMSPFGASGPNAFTWSSCSRASLQELLRRNTANCLYNDPGDVNNGLHLPQPSGPPGFIYTADDQCKLNYGSKASYYYNTMVNDDDACGGVSDQGTLLQTNHISRVNQRVADPCNQIVCIEPTQGRIIVGTAPLFDGTDVNNTRTMCIGGVSVAMNSSMSLDPVDGGFSNWTEDYTMCSRSCGGGVKLKRRTCTNPRPRYGGKGCDGVDITAIMCNMQDCPDNILHPKCSIAEERFPNETWVPVLGDDTCKLRCQAYDKIYKSDCQLPSGTACGRPSGAVFQRCVDGMCRLFGCDGSMDSGVMFDKCGVCNGNNTTCTRVFGTYNNSQNMDAYNTVQTIPRRSTSVLIKQYNADSFLRLLVDGVPVFHDLITGNSGTHLLDGITVQFDKNDVSTLPLQEIRIYGPLKKDVEVQVHRFYTSTVPNITYEYYVPKTQQSTVYNWAVFYAQCTKSCDTGMTVVRIDCVTFSTKVPDFLCNLREKPSEIPIPCNPFPCPAQWHTGPWSTCSKSCDNGIKYRNVTCVRIRNNKFETLSDVLCPTAHKPVTNSTCHIRSCPGFWRAGDYGPCNQTCGVGMKTRPMTCHRFPNSTEEIDPRLCDDDDKLDVAMKCLDQPCYFPPICQDKVPHCRETYGHDICYGVYHMWAFTNCADTCQVCGHCTDHDPLACKVYVTNNRMFCQQYRKWSMINCPLTCGFCDPCGPLPEVTNGSPLVSERRTSYPGGSVIQYRCAVGYVMHGHATVTCVASGQWSTPPTCLSSVKCGPLPSVLNGYPVEPVSHSVGSVVNYACVSGYQISAVSSVTCMPSGGWSDPPFCKEPCVNLRDNCDMYDTRTCYEPKYMPFWRMNCPENCGFCDDGH